MVSQENADQNLPNKVSHIFDPKQWRDIEEFSNLEDITYHRQVKRTRNSQGNIEIIDLPTVRIAFNRPEIRNAFRPKTVDELYKTLDHARMTVDVGVILLTGNGPSSKDRKWAFCSGGDQRVRGDSGYLYEDYVSSDSSKVINTELSELSKESTSTGNSGSNSATLGRLHILEVQRLIRTMPKVVIAVVSGWAAGGGHSLHVVADLTIASEEYAKFKQTDATVASFDAGYGSALLARQVGQKFAREIFFLAREYSAKDMKDMGAVNEVVPHEKLEVVALEYAEQILRQSPQAIRMLKLAFNMVDDGMSGQQMFAGEATRLAYMTAEAREGKNAFLEKREPQWGDHPWYF